MNDFSDGTDVVLTVRDLRVAYERAGNVVEVLHGIDLDIHAGEVVALVGESGSGKSTIAHSIGRMLAGNARAQASQMDFQNAKQKRALLALSQEEWRQLRGRDIGWVPQDPGVSLDPVRRVGQQIAQVLVVHQLATPANAQRAAVDILRSVGLDEPELRAKQYPHQLSGGQRQRVLIGIAIAANPRLIIADEPTSALDVTTQRVIMDLLLRVAAEHGSSILFITHDLALAAERADRVVVLKDGHVVEAGAAEQVFFNPQHAYTKRLVAATPTLEQAPKKSQNHSRSSETIIQVQGLSKAFGTRGFWRRRDVHHAVDGVSFSVSKGSTLGIVGESGSGKSTTARLLTRLYEADAGQVHILGKDIAKLRGQALRQMRRKVQFVHQDPFASLDARRTVGQIIATSLDAFGVGSKAERLARVVELIEQVALPPDVIGRCPRELSGGQRQRVAIARALAIRPEIIVLDEPVTALDVLVQEQILELLLALQRQHGLTYVFISHNLAVVRSFCDDVLVMKQGRVVEMGAAETLLASSIDPYTRELVNAVPAPLIVTSPPQQLRA